MSLVLETLRTRLSTLGLAAMDASLEAHLERAAKEEASYAPFLCDLLAEEVTVRQDRVLATRLRVAHLPYQKTLSQFDFSFQPAIDRRQIRELETLRFVADASNVILLGPPGVGKTHLATGLAIAAMQGGYSAYFTSAQEMGVELGKAAREGRLAERLRVYLRPKVLVVDEVGYLPLDRVGATLFFPLISARYERGSIVLTSNKSYGDWGEIFGELTLASAILDRLLHHSTTINIRGESYRLKERRKAGLLGGAGSDGGGAGAEGSAGSNVT
jgi:DNA replication protein DnaC